MAKAIWNDKVVAESDRFELVEGNVYFPKASVKPEYLRESQTHTTCPWKGLASYYDLVVDGKVNPDAAWYYQTPSAAAANMLDHVAFWHGVQVQR